MLGAPLVARAVALPSAAPSAAASARHAATLPAGSTIEFTLASGVNSATATAGESVPIRLASDLVVGGQTVASAGTMTTMHIVSVRKAAAPDRDGGVQIALDPLALTGGLSLPLQPRHAFITNVLTAGEASTNQTEDTVKDVVFPLHAVYEAVRRGRDLVLPAGSILRAESGASLVTAASGRVEIARVPSLVIDNGDPVYSAIVPEPFYTVPPTLAGKPTAAPSPRPTAPPTQTPAPSPSPSPAS